MTAHRGWEAAWRSLTGSIWVCRICDLCPADCAEGCHHEAGL